MKGRNIGLVSIVHCFQTSLAGNLGYEIVISRRYRMTIRIGDPNSYKRQVGPVGTKDLAVGHELDSGRGACRMDLFFHYRFVTGPRHGPQYARFKWNTPLNMQIVALLLFYSKATAVKKELNFSGLAIVAPHIDDLTGRPVPVGEKMKHG